VLAVDVNSEYAIIQAVSFHFLKKVEQFYEYKKKFCVDFVFVAFDII
jgi:hypothetical protein